MAKIFFSESAKGNSFSVFPDGTGSVFSRLKKDDLILIGIMFILLGDGCEDKELLVILGLLFVSDKTSIKDKLFGK